jgi:hypothetical protein
MKATRSRSNCDGAREPAKAGTLLSSSVGEFFCAVLAKSAEWLRQTTANV